ncbi:MAG: PDZ domain-containing protein [Helicobacteraceae bacterium]|nr:PDZ domain-containing protein [Helicobacteraceae bacterium]
MAFVVCTLAAFACAAPLDEFAPCAEKNRLAFAREGAFTGLAIDKKRLLVPLGLLGADKLPKTWSLERYDPMTGMAIVRAKHELVPIVFRKADRVNEHKNLLLMSDAEAVIVPVTSLIRQHGMKPARVPNRSVSGSPLSAPCYSVVGVSMFGAIIESDFLERFIASGEPFGDLGFRLEGDKARYINPFIKDNPFQEGDQIKAINGARFEAPRELERAILFLIPADDANVTVRRGGADITIKAKVFPRLGGFLKADTFMEHIGWNLSGDLFVRDIGGSTLPILVGDQLVAIGGKAVKTPKEARAALSERKGAVRLLMQRDDFQFFITIETDSQ